MTYYNIFLVLILIVAVLLVLIIMVQSPKGGGLSSTFGGGGHIGGVQSTNDFLDKGTWTLAILMVGLILVASITIPRKTDDNSAIEQTLEDREIPAGDVLPEVPEEQPATTPEK